MYRIIKPAGVTSNITVENTDTMASVIIGKVTRDIITTLAKGGYDTPKDIADAWNISIDTETAGTLCRMAMRMNKPKRDQSKKAKDLYPNMKDENVDAFDLIFGI